MLRTLSLASLQASLLAAMGLSFTGCGTHVAVDGEGAGGSSADAGSRFKCLDPAPIPAKNGAASGFERCADGSIRRVKAVAVDPPIDPPSCAGDETVLDCKSDADCTEKPHGKCGSYAGLESHYNPYSSCRCSYVCETDPDCGPGQACVGVAVPGHGPRAYCAPATCTGSKDCASGECVLAQVRACGDDLRLVCLSAADQCRVDADCAEDSAGMPGNCVLSEAPLPSWYCTSQDCPIPGRPLLVDGRAQTAAPAERDDWAAFDLTVDLTDLHRINPSPDV